MKAKDIMTRSPQCVTPDTSLVDAARLMREADVGVLPVVDAGDARILLGVLTDRDITTRAVAEGRDPRSTSVGDVMSRSVSTCKPEDSVNDVMEVMGREQLRRIPIVDERGSLVGIVAQADIVLEVRDSDKAEKTVERISEKR